MHIGVTFAENSTIVNVGDGIMLVVKGTWYVDNWCREPWQSVGLLQCCISHPLDKYAFVATAQQVWT